MGRVWIGLAAWISLIFLCACQTSDRLSEATPKPSLSQTLKRSDIISLPYKFHAGSIFVIELRSETGRILPFIIDTGATRSALFRSTVKDMELVHFENKAINVLGMTTMEERPVVNIPWLQAGAVSIKNLEVAVLDDRRNPVETSLHPAGVLGMDVLSNYRIFVDGENETFNLIPISAPSPKIPYNWQYVTLYKNPYVDLDFDLHFMDIRMGGQVFTALLDTGSEFNLMNWNGTQIPLIRRIRHRLLKKWEIEGAVGVFKPVHRVTAQSIRSGQKFWDRREFIVMDFEGLEILGIKSNPFLIAGSNLFAGQTFYLDFENDELRFEKDLDVKSGMTLTSKQTVYQKYEDSDR